MVRQVRDVVAKSFPDAVTLDAVSRRLNLSSRTVERRLHEEGSSLRAIKDASRRRHRTLPLQKSDQPVAQIAPGLGYARHLDVLSACDAWTGFFSDRLPPARAGRCWNGL